MVPLTLLLTNPAVFAIIEKVFYNFLQLLFDCEGKRYD